MDKRRLAATLLLGALLFAAAFHTVLALFVFDTGLADVGVLVGVVALVGLVLVNL